MPDEIDRPQMEEVQSAASRLSEAESDERVSAFENFARTVLLHHGIDASRATPHVFSNRASSELQRFTASWLLWVLRESPTALDFDKIEAMTGSLFDRTLQQQLYKAASVDPGDQNFEKLKGLTNHVSMIVDDIERAVDVTPSLERLNAFRQGLMQLLNRHSTRYVLSPLLPKALSQERVNALFYAVED